MGKIINGKYIYSMEDCRCTYCLHYDPKTESCLIAICCCLAEKSEALRHFPPDGFERQRRCIPCRG